MRKELVSGDRVIGAAGRVYEVGHELGRGTQGMVFAGRRDDGVEVALKWYFAAFATPAFDAHLRSLIVRGPPTDAFAWPLDRVESSTVGGFGYAMPKLAPSFVSMAAVLRGHHDPDTEALARVGAELAAAFKELHARGLCYRDISWNNVFLDPARGAVRIIDNDSVVSNGDTTGGILGTPKFMAPEILRGAALPSAATDLHSLAVMLFLLFLHHHPLEGARLVNVSLDLRAIVMHFGHYPLFLFDPADTSNGPLRGYHDAPGQRWQFVPEHLRALFRRTFTQGLMDPGARVRESEWTHAFHRMTDAVFTCVCGAQSVVDESNGAVFPGYCWNCGAALGPWLRLMLRDGFLLLCVGAELRERHLDPFRADDGALLGQAVAHPTIPGLLGLRNHTAEKWVLRHTDGIMEDIAPKRAATLRPGVVLIFGNGADGRVV